VTELTEAECGWMIQMAEEQGLCPNCFHTLECCADKCASPNDMTHKCVSRPEEKP
jgi:hypothetical protein